MQIVVTQYSIFEPSVRYFDSTESAGQWIAILMANEVRFDVSYQ